MKGSIKERILLILGLVFLVVLFGLLIYDLTRKGIYSDKMGINIAVVGERGVNILLLRPEEQMVSWVTLPTNIRVKVFNSGAEYPLDSIWNLGVSEKRPFETMERSLGQAMGIIISRVIKIDKGGQVENVLGKLISLDLKTDLTIRDRMLIRSFLTDAIKSKKILELSVPASVFDKVTDPDGKTFLEFNQTMNLWTKNKFVIESVLNENADISINNVSNVPGSGNILGNQLESSGMHVVEVKADQGEKIDGKNCVYSTTKEFKVTEKVLKEQVGCKKIANPSFGDDERLRIWIK